MIKAEDKILLYSNDSFVKYSDNFKRKYGLQLVHCPGRIEVDFSFLKNFFLLSLVFYKWNTTTSEDNKLLVTHLLLLFEERFNLHMNPVLFFGFQS